VRSPDGFGTRLGKTEVQNFSFLYEILDRASHIFDGDLWINSVLVIKINAVGS
jgi:hypothetical protein